MQTITDIMTMGKRTKYREHYEDCCRVYIANATHVEPGWRNNGTVVAQAAKIVGARMANKANAPILAC